MTGEGWEGRIPHNVVFNASDHSAVTVALFIGVEMWRRCLSVSLSGERWGGAGAVTLVLEGGGQKIH